MLKIKWSDYELIKGIAERESLLYSRGCNKQTIFEHEKRRELINKYGKQDDSFEFKKGKSYIFVYTEKENMGTAKFPNIHKRLNITYSPLVYERMTDCYYVFKFRKYKKDSVLAIIEN